MKFEMNRRTFLRGSLAAGMAPFLDGCASFGLGPKSAAPTPNYFCTWATQARTIALMKAKGESMFPGDQGLPGCRDNLDEKTIFGEAGWARALYPESRQNLNFVLDDGWDVDYGLNPYQHTAKFGSLILNEKRFPSIKGTPAQRLAELSHRLKDLGWAGCGLWVACQAPGESWSHHEPKAVQEEDLRRKLGWCGEAGIAYLKVDWGAHDADIAYREMMSRLAKEYCPATQIEHALTWGIPLNGCYEGWKEGKKILNIVSKGRLLNDVNYAVRIGSKAPALMRCGDVFRIYDMLSPIFYPSAIERVLMLLTAAEATGGHAQINVEDLPYLGASLACSLGIMRAPIWENTSSDLIARHQTCGEVTRALAWQTFAPPQGANQAMPTRYSNTTLTDEWTFTKNETWLNIIADKTIPQTTAAIVTRGMNAFPDVVDVGEGVPFVTAMRHANGALALAALPRVVNRKGFKFPKADVTIFEDPRNVPIGIFGSFRSIAFECPTKDVRVWARDLAGKDMHDITAACTFTPGRIILPGDELSAIGTEALSDRSMPGTFVEIRA